MSTVSITPLCTWTKLNRSTPPPAPRTSLGQAKFFLPHTATARQGIPALRPPHRQSSQLPAKPKRSLPFLRRLWYHGNSGGSKQVKAPSQVAEDLLPRIYPLENQVYHHESNLLYICRPIPSPLRRGGAVYLPLGQGADCQRRPGGDRHLQRTEVALPRACGRSAGLPLPLSQSPGWPFPCVKAHRRFLEDPQSIETPPL